MKLLIAEGNQQARVELVAQTSQCGYEVVAVDAWKTALDVLQQDNEPTLILLGFDTSEFTRAEICRKIKLIKPRHSSYVLLLSSPIDIDDTAASLLAGANDYISSPPESTELRIRLDVAQSVIGLNQAKGKGFEPIPKYEGTQPNDASLQVQLQHCRSMLDNVGAYIYTKDTEGRYTYVNNKVCELFSRSLDEIIGCYDSQFFTLSESSDLRVNDNIALKNNKATEAEERNVIAKTGEVRYYTTVKKPLLDANGRVTGLLGISTDISETKEKDIKLKALLRKTAIQAQELEDKKELYDIVFKNTSNGILILDSDSFKFTSCNIQAAAMLGYTSKADILNASPLKFSPEFQLGGVRSDEKAKEMCALAVNSGAQVFEWQHLKINNDLIWIEVSLTPVMLKNRQVFHVSWKDINDRKEAEASSALSSRVFHDVNEAILIATADRKIIDANPAFCELAGYSHDELKGRVGRHLHSNKYPEEFFDEIWQYVKANGYWRGEIDVQGKSNGIKTCQLTISTVLNEGGGVVNYVGMYIDLTERKKQQKKLTLLAHYDSLTGLPNRLLFTDRFKQAAAYSKRYKTPLAICFLDLDGFKLVNDEFGHNVGDKLLIQVAERISSSIRDEDTVSRQGGDEFALLLGGFESRQQCKRIINRMLQLLEGAYLIDGFSHYITASCGIALYPVNEEELDALILQADQAMYSSKRAGKNQLSFFSS